MHNSADVDKATSRQIPKTMEQIPKTFRNKLLKRQIPKTFTKVIGAVMHNNTSGVKFNKIWTISNYVS